MRSMAEKRVYLVRHGETASNRSLRHQARSTPLDARGVRQAALTAHALAALPIDSIITSGATRTQQTALPLLEAVHCPVVNNPFFEELRRPSVAVGKKYLDPRALWAVVRVYLHAIGVRAKHSDEETVSEFRQRAADAIALLASDPAKHLVVFSHRLFISGALAIISGSAEGSTTAFLRAAFRFGRIPNGSITELSYNSARATPWHIERFADTRHLSDA